MVIHLFEKGENLSGLTQDKLVERTFESYLDGILKLKKYPESGERRRELLNWLSGIGSIEAEDSQICEKLAKILKVEPYEVKQDRDELIRSGLLIQIGRKQRVFPDALGDYILRKVMFSVQRETVLFSQKAIGGVFTTSPCQGGHQSRSCGKHHGGKKSP